MVDIALFTLELVDHWALAGIEKLKTVIKINRRQVVKHKEVGARQKSGSCFF